MSYILHLMVWKLNGTSPEERAVQVRMMMQAFEALRSQVQGLCLQLQAGANLEAAGA